MCGPIHRHLLLYPTCLPAQYQPFSLIPSPLSHPQLVSLPFPHRLHPSPYLTLTSISSPYRFQRHLSLTSSLSWPHIILRFPVSPSQLSPHPLLFLLYSSLLLPPSCADVFLLPFLPIFFLLFFFLPLLSRPHWHTLALNRPPSSTSHQPPRQALIRHPAHNRICASVSLHHIFPPSLFAYPRSYNHLQFVVRPSQF